MSYPEAKRAEGWTVEGAGGLDSRRYCREREDWTVEEAVVVLPHAFRREFRKSEGWGCHPAL